MNKARIEMAIQATEEEIIFVINNTIASHKEEARTEKRDSIGLKNVQKQLDLLYPNMHELTIEQTATKYEVRLKLKVK